MKKISRKKRFFLILFLSELFFLALISVLTIFNWFSFRDSSAMFYYLMRIKCTQSISASLELTVYPNKKKYILSKTECEKLLKILKNSKIKDKFPVKTRFASATPFISINIQKAKFNLKILYFDEQLYFESLSSTNQIDNEELKFLLKKIFIKHFKEYADLLKY